MTQYLIQEATVDDIAHFKQFLVKAWHEAGPNAIGWSGASDEQIEEITRDTFLSSLLTRVGTQLFLALEGGEVIGFAVNTQHDEDVVELSGMIVLESRTGRGVGRALLQYAINHACSDEASRLIVQTERTNHRAIKFYRNHGFRIQKETMTTIGDTQIELITLTLTLT